MKRKLLCQIFHKLYSICRHKEILKRKIKNLIFDKKIAKKKSNEILSIVLYKHNSLIRRKLNNVDLQLQENKAVNLGIATPKVNKIIIRPGETFSFWALVGSLTKKKGYLEGLTVKTGTVDKDIGGGMCQFTNLIHWMVLHSGLEIVEYHHHNGIDMFPDFGRKVPFGTGTSIMYNSLDYRFYNSSKDITYQLITYTTDEYLMGELRCDKPEPCKYHIEEEYSYFEEVDGVWYRNNQVSRKCIDKVTGNELSRKVISKNHAKVLYDSKFININMIKENKKAI